MSAPGSLSGTPVTRRLRLLVVLLGVVPMAGVVSASHNSASLATFSSAGWTTSATPANDTVSPGDEITIEVTVEASRRRRALVDLEIHDPAGRRVFQEFWDDQRFEPNSPRTFTATWQVPPGEPDGQYVVQIGILRRWGMPYHWNAASATFTVTGPPATTVAPPAPTTASPR